MKTTRQLSATEAAAFAAELDALRAEIDGDLGQADVDHIRAVIRVAMLSAAAGRILLHAGIGPVSFAAGTGALALAKILENMEVGHNVMHGQYDWTGDPALDSRRYDWDLVCAAIDWRHLHNVEHHTFTNIIGKDRDVGYQMLRVSAKQPWRPYHLVQPVTAALLALGFQWGVALHDLRLPEFLAGEQSWQQLRERSRPFRAKVQRQLAKDYLLFPCLALWNAPRVFAGNLLANMTRNVWTFAVIFCGHFPDGVRFYEEADISAESRGHWYARQMNGSANIEGGRSFHILTGHLSHQIEHHLFPDLPAARYPEMAPRVRDICARYGQHYCTASFATQLRSVARSILRYARPRVSSSRRWSGSPDRGSSQ